MGRVWVAKDSPDHKNIAPCPNCNGKGYAMVATDQMVCDMVDAGCKVAEAQASWLQERAIENAQQDMKTTDLPSTRQGFNAILQAAAKYGCKLVAADGSVVTF